MYQNVNSSFQITHDNLIVCRACQAIGTSHDKDENSSENQKCFNRLWFINYYVMEASVNNLKVIQNALTNFKSGNNPNILFTL